MEESARPKRGRPRRTEGTKHITFKNSTYELWKATKVEMGMAGIDNSRFADIILLKVSEESVEDVEDNNSVGVTPASRRASKRRRLWSTPRAATGGRNSLHEMGLDSLACSPIVDEINEDEERVEDESVDEANKTLAEELQEVNKSYASLAGDPFEGSNHSDEDTSTSDESDSHSDDDHESETLSLADCRSEEDDNEGLDLLECEDGSATITALEIDETESCSEDGESEAQQQAESLEPRQYSENIVNDEVVLEEYEDPKIGCQSLKDYCLLMKTKLESELKKLKDCRKELQSYVTHFETQRAIVEVPKLVELLSGKCSTQNCSHMRKVTHTTTTGAVIIISYTCPGGHSGIWHSSSVLCQKRGQNIYVLPTLLSAGTLITGNNFDKVELLFRFCSIEFISSTTFNRMQSLYVVPTVQSFWDGMKQSLVKMYNKETIVLCGDGRMDSPGFSAKYCAYVIMEHHLGSIIDLEVVDKRETGGSSTNMERLGLKRLLERLMHLLCIGELTTDASATIIKLVRDLKELNPSELEALFHSLDIWHKSCKLSVKLAAAAKIKGNDSISEWAEPIRNHFWHCAEVSNGDFEVLKDKWLGVIHHICGEHEWAEGACTHGPLTELEQQKAYLEKGSKPFKAVQEIVFDRQWLESLKFYVFFRHTSQLESFNSMVLKYAPKRNAFSYEPFTARVELAAIDHNFHLMRAVIPGRYKRVFSKRSKNWHVVPVKVPKTYPYWKVLSAEVLKRRTGDESPVTRHIEVAEHDPVNIAPNIAMRQPPSTSEMVEARFSRFQSKC